MSDNIKALLRAFPGLAKIKDKEWRKAFEAASCVSIPAGTTVLQKNEQCQQFMFPLSGSIRISSTDDSGRTITLYRVEPGDICILTLVSMFQGRAFPAEAITESRLDGLVLSIPQFMEAFNASAGLRNYVLDIMTRRMGDLIMLVQELTFSRLDVRLSWKLANYFKHQKEDTLHTTHQELADELGSTREVVSRILKDLERMNCIRLRRGAIELISRDTLEEFAGPGRFN